MHHGNILSFHVRVFDQLKNSAQDQPTLVYADKLMSLSEVKHFLSACKRMRRGSLAEAARNISKPFLACKATDLEHDALWVAIAEDGLGISIRCVFPEFLRTSEQDEVSLDNLGALVRATKTSKRTT